MPLPAARFSAVRSPFKFSLGLAAAFVLVACLPSSRALSWPLCAEGSSSWVTENPFTAPIFPGANLWFFCRAGINVAGSAVDACYSRGSVCDQDAAADALCAVVGYDRAVYDETSLAVVSGTGCAIRSLTGEYTLGGGSYSSTKPDPNLAQGCTPRPLGSESRLPVPGLQANDVVVLDGITCVRSINTIRSAASRLGLGGEGSSEPSSVPSTLVPSPTPDATPSSPSPAPSSPSPAPSSPSPAPSSPSPTPSSPSPTPSSPSPAPSSPSPAPSSPSSSPSSPSPTPISAGPSPNLPLPELERSQAAAGDALSAASASGAGQQTRRRLRL